MTKHNDLDARNANEAIKQIAIDLLEGKRIEITYRNGADRPIQGFLIKAAPQEYPDLPFTAQVAGRSQAAPFMEYFGISAEQVLTPRPLFPQPLIPREVLALCYPQ